MVQPLFVIGGTSPTPPLRKGYHPEVETGQIVFLFGPPCVGKSQLIRSVQSLFDKFKYRSVRSVSTSDLPGVRQGDGGLAPDALVCSKFRGCMTRRGYFSPRNNCRVICDGMPRTREQVRRVHGMIFDEGDYLCNKVSFVVLSRPEEVIRAFHDERRGREKREDDLPALFEGRLKTFKRHLPEVLDEMSKYNLPVLHFDMGEMMDPRDLAISFVRTVGWPLFSIA